ncbi:MAG: hypothetical protein MZV63_42155 [Marinilabiliales bacterium]|nr:hypothetical protein [Marinilabiliales bacterium]
MQGVLAKNFYDFLNRVIAGIEQLKYANQSEAMRFVGISKQQLLWEAHWYFFEKMQSFTKVNALFDEPSR